MWFKNSIHLVYFISFVDLFAIGLTFPLFANHLRDLGASHTYIGFLSSLYSGLQFVSGPIIGGWTDIRDRKSVLKKILFLCAISYGYLGLTSSFTVIFIIRFILGCFKHIQSICKAVITDVVPKNKQTGVFGVSSAVSSIGFIIGPFLGGHIAELPNGFTYVSLLTMMLFLINIVIVGHFPEMKKSKSDKKMPVESCQKGVLNQIGEEIKKSVNEVKYIDWVQYWEPFFLRFLFSMAMTTYFSNQSLLLKEKYQLSQKHIGYTISFFSSVGLFVAFSLRKINIFYKDNDCLTKILHFFTLMTLSVIAISFSHNFYVFLLATIPFSVSTTALRIITMEYVLLKTSDEHKGSFLGASNSIMSVSRFIAPLVTGVVGDLFGEEYSILFAVVPALLGIATCFHLKWRQA